MSFRYIHGLGYKNMLEIHILKKYLLKNIALGLVI